MAFTKSGAVSSSHLMESGGWALDLIAKNASTTTRFVHLRADTNPLTNARPDVIFMTQKSGGTLSRPPSHKHRIPVLTLSGPLQKLNLNPNCTWRGPIA